MGKKRTFHIEQNHAMKKGALNEFEDGDEGGSGDRGSFFTIFCT